MEMKNSVEQCIPPTAISCTCIFWKGEFTENRKIILSISMVIETRCQCKLNYIIHFQNCNKIAKQKRLLSPKINSGTHSLVSFWSISKFFLAIWAKYSSESRIEGSILWELFSTFYITDGGLVVNRDTTGLQEHGFQSWLDLQVSMNELKPK